jgi:DNA-directed RNA polymerase subunit RPC12/RpoP
MSRPQRGTRGDHSSRPSQFTVAGGSFTCIHCGATIPENAPGTGQRNHCPRCLWSIHVDIRPGDRSSLCRAPMEPITLWADKSGEVRVIHRCTGCGMLKANRIAGDDEESALQALIASLQSAGFGG